MVRSPSPERESLVLLHAPIGRDAKLLHELLQHARIESQVCPRVEDLCREMAGGAGAVFVAEEALDPNAVQHLANFLRRQGPWSDLPMVVLTLRGEANEASRARLAQLEPLGDLTLLERPLRVDTIISTARTALRARARQYEVRRRDAELQTERKQSERALGESERQFRNLADSIPHLAWMANADGHVFWYNQRWYDYTGGTAEEMTGWGWQLAHDPAMLPEVLQRWRECIRTETLFEMVFPLRGADGVFRLFLTRVVPVRDISGKVTRWFGTNTDIDEQKRVEEALRRANRDLEQVAYVTSHDLQEPLRMVNIYSQLLLKRLGPQTDVQLQEFAGYVRTGVRRLELLIRDLLDYARATHDQDGAFAGIADMTSALRRAMSLVDTSVQENQAEITLEPLPSVIGDEAQLSHVFQNLLSNAIKYRKPAEAPRVRVGARKLDGQWVISVRDNGIGFDQEQAERIFGLFKRLHREEEYPGTGLGLAICKHIVERHRGRIWAESQPGVGSTFFVALPGAPNE